MCLSTILTKKLYQKKLDQIGTTAPYTNCASTNPLQIMCFSWAKMLITSFFEHLRIKVNKMRRTLDSSFQIMSSISQISLLVFVSA